MRTPRRQTDNTDDIHTIMGSDKHKGTDKHPLKYSGEEDRSYGLAGMAISLTIFDGGDMLSALSLDNAPGEGAEMAPEFHFSGNPALSIGAAWRHTVKQFELSAAMLVGNALCRAYVGRKTRLDPDAGKALRVFVEQVGCDTCALDGDEVDRLYDKVRSNLERVFMHSRVASVATSFAETLRQRRRLTAAEVADVLAPLM